MHLGKLVIFGLCITVLIWMLMIILYAFGVRQLSFLEACVVLLIPVITLILALF